MPNNIDSAANEIMQLDEIYPDFQLRLVPYNEKVQADDLITPKTILLRKKPSGKIVATLLINGQESSPFEDLGLNSGEVEVMDFPTSGMSPVVIQRDQYPELVDKVSFRVGLIEGKLGRVSAALNAFGCGATTSAALFAAIGFTPLSFALGGLFGVSSMIANYRMSEMDLPEILQGGFYYLFENKRRIVSPEGNQFDQYVSEPVSTSRKWLIAFGMACSLAMGATFAVLTYVSILELPLALGFTSGMAASVAAAVVPPLGIIIAAATFVSLSIIMTKAIADTLKNKNLWASIKKSADNIFYMDSEDKKSAFNIVYRLFAWVGFGVVSAVLLGLALTGTCFTQLACVDGMVKIFDVSSNILKNLMLFGLGGLSLLAQIPFVVKAVLNPVLYFFFRWDDAAENNVDASVQQGAESDMTNVMMGPVASFINALANAVIPLRGKADRLFVDVLLFLGTLGAFFNSFLSTFGNRVPSDIPPPRPEEPQQSNLESSSTQQVLGKLIENPDINVAKDVLIPGVQNDNQFTQPEAMPGVSGFSFLNEARELNTVDVISEQSPYMAYAAK